MSPLDKLQRPIERIESKLDNHLERIAQIEIRVQSINRQLSGVWLLLVTMAGAITAAWLSRGG